MQPTISIPKHWDYPRFMFGQRTQQGIVIGMEYNPADTYLAHEYGNSWRYTVIPNKHSDEVRHYSDEQLQTLSVAELQAQLQAEIDIHQQQIKVLQQQLAAIKGGSNG